MESRPATGSSVYYCDYIVKKQIREIDPKSIVDFGAGSGKYSFFVREILGDSCHITAVEGYKRAADMLLNKNCYDVVCNSLLEEWLETNNTTYDLAIFGDVLEHLKPVIIKKVLEMAVSKFKNIIIVVPLYDIFQDAKYGNILEIHQAYITPNFFDRYHPIEKHIIRKESTVMNVLLANRPPDQIHRRFAKFIFHNIICILQPLGLARPFVEFLKRFFVRCKSVVRS